MRHRSGTVDFVQDRHPQMCDVRGADRPVLKMDGLVRKEHGVVQPPHARVQDERRRRAPAAPQVEEGRVAAVQRELRPARVVEVRIRSSMRGKLGAILYRRAFWERELIRGGGKG